MGLYVIGSVRYLAGKIGVGIFNFSARIALVVYFKTVADMTRLIDCVNARLNDRYLGVCRIVYDECRVRFGCRQEQAHHGKYECERENSSQDKLPKSARWHPGYCWNSAPVYVVAAIYVLLQLCERDASRNSPVTYGVWLCERSARQTFDASVSGFLLGDPYPGQLFTPVPVSTEPGPHV